MLISILLLMRAPHAVNQIGQLFEVIVIMYDLQKFGITQ